MHLGPGLRMARLARCSHCARSAGRTRAGFPARHSPGADHDRRRLHRRRQRTRASPLSRAQGLRARRNATPTSARSRRARWCTRRCAPAARCTSSIPTCRTSSTPRTSRSFISATRPTCCPRGTAPSRCAWWRTTARSTPSGAIAPTWTPAAPRCRANAIRFSPAMPPTR